MRKSFFTPMFRSRGQVWILSVILLCALISAVFSGCAGPSGTTVSETTGGSSTAAVTTTQESSAEPTESVSPAVELTNLNDVFYTPDFGEVIVSPNFYWSPNAGYCLFVGHVRADQQQYVPAAYLYDVENDQLVKLIGGQAGKNYYLAEPAWSPDETQVTVQFYLFEETDYRLALYDLTAAEVRELPVAGTQPLFSLDGRQLAYTDQDGAIRFFDLENNQIVSNPADNLLGFSPVLFSDQRRLLYVAPTGNNPSNLEYGWLSEIRLAELGQPGAGQVIMPESSYHTIRWLLPDQLALVESGMDDGFFTEILHVGTSTVKDLGETRLALSRSWDQSVNLVSYDIQEELFRQYDQNLNETNAYSLANGYNATVISLLPGNRLLYLNQVSGSSQSELSVLSASGPDSLPVAFYNGDLIAVTAPDGTHAAFFDQESSRFFILETQDFYDLINRPFL